jgi:hypothetical protein
VKREPNARPRTRAKICTRPMALARATTSARVREKAGAGVIARARVKQFRVKTIYTKSYLNLK